MIYKSLSFRTVSFQLEFNLALAALTALAMTLARDDSGLARLSSLMIRLLLATRCVFILHTR